MIFTYNDFRNYCNYAESRTLPLLWLSGFDKTISETYGIRLMPTYYDVIESGGTTLYRFFIIPYSDDDYRNFKPKTGNVTDELKVLVMGQIEKYCCPAIEKNGRVLVFFDRPYLFYYRHYHLLSHIACEKIEEIKKFFSRLNPVEVSRDMNCFTCILKTKKQAAEFVISNEYNKIQGQIYTLLKPYDEYDVLKKEHIFIFADYEEHKKTSNMYHRWICDMTYSDMRKYMNSLQENL